MAGYAELSLARSMNFLADSQAAISNNIANATTHSFKRKLPVAHSGSQGFFSMLNRTLPSVTYAESTDFTPGSQRAGDKMNAALGKDQFFRVQDGNGTFYTRRGEFIVDSSGNLVSPNGEAFLGRDDQPIQVNNAQELRIETDGTVNGLVDGQERTLGQLGVYEVSDPDRLVSIGRSLYMDRGNQPVSLAAAPSVRQGYVEESNVDVLKELISMITVQRSFGATTKAMTTVDGIHSSYVQAMMR